MKHNEKTDTLLFLLSFPKCKYTESIFFVSAGLDFGTTLTEYLSNLKFLTTQSIFVFLSTDKKAKKISLKIFKIMGVKS